MGQLTLYAKSAQYIRTAKNPVSRRWRLASVGRGKSIPLLGSASERAKGGAVWAKSGHLAQYHYHILLDRLGVGEGERANTSAGSRA